MESDSFNIDHVELKPVVLDPVEFDPSWFLGLVE